MERRFIVNIFIHYCVLLFVLFYLASCKSSDGEEVSIVDNLEEKEVIDETNLIPNPPKPEKEAEIVEVPITPPSEQLIEYLTASAINDEIVDRYFGMSELSRRRSLVNDDQVDKCDVNKNVYENDNFSDQIHYYSEVMLNEISSKIGFVGSYYGVSSDDSKIKNVSLISHPLCKSSSSSLGSTIKKMPNATTIARLNRFEDKMNGLRTRYLSGDKTAKKDLLIGWGKLFSCLSYTESLSTADQASSKNVASSNAPTGYKKPNGVKFYNDPAQNEASRLNIGMFQFTPNSSGNVKPCLLAWNELHKNNLSCQVKANGTKADLIKYLGSSYQSFNAFCGIHKVVQTFTIQANTTKSSATYPGNLAKSFENRCVTPHFYAGWAYNHFGPFQNSTSENLEKLYKCVEAI